MPLKTNSPAGDLAQRHTHHSGGNAVASEASPTPLQAGGNSAAGGSAAVTGRRSMSSAGAFPVGTSAGRAQHAEEDATPAAVPGSPVGSADVAGGSVRGGSVHGRASAGGAIAPAQTAQPGYGSRSSDSGGAPGSPPVKPSAPSQGAATAAHNRGRLQQLGHKLGPFVGLGRKKHTTFAPGLAGSVTSGAEDNAGPAYPAPAPSFALPEATPAHQEAGASAAAAGTERFHPPNHPMNPFAYLATPFRVMAKTKAGAAMGRYATTALRLRRDGKPPASYMWLWLGNFKRWQRRYFVASEAPGVLLIYKRANMKGKVWSTSLWNATVAPDDSNPRQLRLVTSSGTVFLRVLRPEERQPWISCLQESIDTFQKHKQVVDTLAAGRDDIAGVSTGVGGLPAVSPGAVEQDAEQRRRIRVRLHERLSELAPHVAEVERHLGSLGQQVAGLAAGLGQLPGPLLANAFVAHGLSIRQRAASTHDNGPISLAGSSVAGAADADATRASVQSATPLASRGAPPEIEAQVAAGDAGNSTPGAGRNDREQSHERLASGRTPSMARSRSRGWLPQGPAVPAPNLAGAIAALVEAVRGTLHGEAARMAALEAENAALEKTLNIMRAGAARAGGRNRGQSGAGAAGLGAGTASARGVAIGGGVGAAAGDDAASEGSVRTADEDAFDIVEAFDEGIDDEGPFVPHGAFPGEVDEEEVDEDDEDEEEDEAELAQQAEVLNALEVVRQVEYIAAHGAAEPLLAADTPPPPDAEEEEEEGPASKKRGKAGARTRGGRAGEGADTDATAGEDDDFDEDDYLSEEAAGGAGAAAAGAGAAPPRRLYEGRAMLPAPKPLGRGFSIWSILKNMIGRDLTKITMPATINEPLSMTQRMAEVLENRSLLDQAVNETRSVDRLMRVAVWLAAGFNSQPLRDNKPFNPLLGETYEWQAPDGSTRYLCEQVSHHPPVSCFAAEGGGPDGYQLYGEVETKTKFWGRTIDCILAGHGSLNFKAHGDQFRFNLGTLVINDIILGRFWIDLSCDLNIRNAATGESARVLIKPCRGYGHLNERGKCEGVVCDARGQPVWRIQGSSMQALHASLTPEAAAERGASSEPQLIWTKTPQVPNPREQYFLTRFALGMNDPADPIVPHLPPTDARFRPDMRALELGEWNRATSEKLRLEEKQRTARRVRKEAGEEYQPRWFRQVMFDVKEMTATAHQPGSVWEWTGEYWAARERKEWGRCPDIY